MKNTAVSSPPPIRGGAQRPFQILKNLLKRIPIVASAADYLSDIAAGDQRSYEAYFLSWIWHRNRALHGISDKRVYFEFGVHKGGSMLKFISAAKKFCRRYREPLNSFYIYGFDSFRGLPEKQEGDDLGNWYTGKYACGLETVKKTVTDTGFPDSNLFLIPGFYQESLTSNLRKQLQIDSVIPAIVNIDCDYYSSTKTILEWLHPLLLSGTVIHFDDIWSFDGHPEMGELRAINEFNQQGHGHLTPRGLHGYREQTYIYSAKNWEFGEDNRRSKR